MPAFWIGHQMLGDVLGFCAAAHLYSVKTGQPTKVWFEPARKAACNFFDGVEWVEKTPDMINCGGDPSLAEWPQMNGVKRFYRFMDPSMSPGKSFDIHFNKVRKPPEGKLIGLITHSNTQGDIDDVTLSEMLAEARRTHPGCRIALIGNKDNTKVPKGVGDMRQEKGDVTWIINTVSKLDLLITPQSGPCFCAAGWKVPMWVYRSKEAFWDYTLNYETYKVERWFSRFKLTSAEPLRGNYRKQYITDFEKFDYLFKGKPLSEAVYIIGSSASMNELEGLHDFIKDKTCCLLNAVNLDARFPGPYHFIHHTLDFEKYLDYYHFGKGTERFNQILASDAFKFIPGYNNLIDLGVCLGDNTFTFSEARKPGILLHHCHNVGRNCGTIASDAMEVMAHIGYKKVYLIGVDLKKTDKHSYYDPTQKDKFWTKPENNVYMNSICEKYPQTQYMTLSPWGAIQDVPLVKAVSFSEVRGK
jgi:hypothetical protein